MARIFSNTPRSITVQPTGRNVSLTRPSSNGNNKVELSTEALVEASKQLPARLEKLQQENDDLRQQVQSLRRTLEMNESDSHENRQQLLVEMERLKQRHAAMAQRKVNMDQRRTENTLSTNRQSDLEREYNDEFRDGTRIDAIETIEAKLATFRKCMANQLPPVDQLKAYRLACFIFEISYECALETKKTFLSYYSSVTNTLVAKAPTLGLPDDKNRKLSELKLSKQSTTTPDSLNEVMVLLKEEAISHDLEKLVQIVKKEVKRKWKEGGKKEKMIPSYEKGLKRDLKSYISYCTQFSWRIVTQVPPLMIDYKSSTYNPSYHTESPAFSSSDERAKTERWACSQERKEIKYYVWPTLYDWENRVIGKGDVVLKESNIYVTSL